MTLNDIAYMVLEGLRNNNIVDDEKIDLRLIKDWVDLKRAQYIKNERSQNPNNRLNLNLYQKLPVSVAVVAVVDAGDYPYIDDSRQLYQIVESTTTIPAIVEDKEGPIIYSLETQDLMKIPFSVVSYDYMRFAGNGKFNSNLIFGSVRDNKVYFKYNTFFDTYTDVVLRAVFENPRDVAGFDDTSDEYPANVGLIEYIKNGIFDKELKVILATPSDITNDASGELKQ